MSCLSIRRLTAAERKARDEQRADRFEELTAEIEAEEMHEYNEQFGPLYKAKYPFQADPERVRQKVEARLRAEENNYNESRTDK